MNENDEKVILLIEDDPDDVELTLRAFEKSKIANDVVVVRDGAEALDFFFGEDPSVINGTAAEPAVVLLDLSIPKIDGFEVLRRIREDERTRLIPVVVLTGSRQEEDMVESFSRGANSYIRKPVDLSEFVAAAAEIGLYWLLLNQTPPLGLRKEEGE